MLVGAYKKCGKRHLDTSVSLLARRPTLSTTVGWLDCPAWSTMEKPQQDAAYRAPGGSRTKQTHLDFIGGGEGREPLWSRWESGKPLWVSPE